LVGRERVGAVAVSRAVEVEGTAHPVVQVAEIGLVDDDLRLEVGRDVDVLARGVRKCQRPAEDHRKLAFERWDEATDFAAQSIDDVVNLAPRLTRR
jgi:hypothetical protein